MEVSCLADHAGALRAPSQDSSQEERDLRSRSAPGAARPRGAHPGGLALGPGGRIYRGASIAGWFHSI